MRGNSSAATGILLGTLLASGAFNGCDGTNPFEPTDEPEVKGPPRQPEVAELGKQARKVYARVMRETQDRETALRAALEVES